MLLRRAIQLDPNYAAAHAALAETFNLAVSMGWAESPAAFLTRAEETANKALSLDDSDVRARVILGRIHIFHHRYDQARAEMDRAIAVNPSDASAIAGRGSIIMWLGETDGALRTLESAPLRSVAREDWVVRLRYAYADLLLKAGRRDDAVEWFHRTLGIDGHQITDAAERLEELEGS